MARRKHISEKSPRKLAKDKQRQHLLNANIECIAKMGLSETSITHISKAANMSRGIINFYFESKEKMMLEALDYLLMQQEMLWKSIINEQASENNLFQLIAEKLLLSPSRRHQRAWMAFAAHAASHPSYGQKFKDASEGLGVALKNRGKTSAEIEQFFISLSGLRLELLLNKASLTQDEKLKLIQLVVVNAKSEDTVLSNDNVVGKKKSVNTAASESPKAKQAKPKKIDNTDAAIGDLFASLG